MSAPPAGNANGVPKPRPNPMRPMRKKTVNPMVARSRRPPTKLGQPSLDVTRPNVPGGTRLNTTWSEEPPAQHTDIPIMMTKKALLDGVRFHLMKFHPPKVDEKPIDPTDQDEFARPVTLHRRDPRQPPPGRATKEEEPERPQVDELELERQAQLREEREAQKAIDQAKIAPVMKNANVPKRRQKKNNNDKTQFNRAPKNMAAKKESDLRYEEALPWHLEDADGKNVWSGTYEAALSESTVAFVIDGPVFRMVPLEKWYKFTPKSRFQALSLEQAEAYMNRKVDVGRWVMKDEEKRTDMAEMEATRRMLYGRGRMVKTESDTFRAASRREKMEHDELDVSGDEFQDDDEAPTFERNDDEDVKESNDRIKREQLGANTFGEGDEQEVDKELLSEMREELDRQKFGKTTKKALIKRDREEIYESDNSEDKPWSSSSEDESTDEDEEDENDSKKDGEGKDAQGDAKDKDKDKDKDKGKGLATKGNTTPQGKLKQTELIKNKKSLKRAGSPNLSESSGNESSRKKKLKKTATPAQGSRSGTPMPAVAARRTKMGAGSGSDGEATGGEMSDGAVKRKIKIAVTGSGSKGTPTASRAGSPNPTQAASPGSAVGSGPIETWEILEQIPAEGIKITDLIKPFHGRVGDKPGQMAKNDWIKMVKQLCDYGQDKRLRRRK